MLIRIPLPYKGSQFSILYLKEVRGWKALYIHILRGRGWIKFVWEVRIQPYPNVSVAPLKNPSPFSAAMAQSGVTQYGY